jgi:hypothetical protein
METDADGLSGATLASSRLVRRKQLWINWLQVALILVLAYSLMLVFAGSVALQLFSWSGFGPSASMNTPEARDYLKLPFMVLGAVMSGWVVLMLQMVRGPLREGSPWAWTHLATSLSVWFALDTSMSLILGHPMHAFFNIPFALLVGIPLLMLRVILPRECRLHQQPR